MSLMHPTTGEMYDRVAVLELKIEHGTATGQKVSHFTEEMLEIISALRSRGKKIDRSVREELVKVHVAIWNMLPLSPTELLELNARRVAIREEIDKLTGEFKGPEKV